MSEFNQNQYINKYIKEKYDRINLTMQAGKKEKIKSAASKRGMSVNEYINCLIDNDLLQNIEWMCYTHMRLIKRGKTHD